MTSNEKYSIVVYLLSQLFFDGVYLLETEQDEFNIKDVCHLSNLRYPDEHHSVGDILETYNDCLQTIEKYTDTQKDKLSKQLLDRLECFKDDLKQQYYAGNVQYSDIEQVKNMEEDLENGGVNENKREKQIRSVHCNADRHSREISQHVIPLVVTGTLTEKKKACEAIFKQEKGRNLTDDIPTPSLDNNQNPKELTVPLVNPSTYKVDSPEARNALTQYYKVVMKCLTLTTEHKIQVFKFNKKFYNWLQEAILPHLKDKECYPAFGGVLRIVQTMKQNDFVPKNSSASFIFYRQKDLGKEEEERRQSENNIKKVVTSSYFLLITIPLLLIIFLLLLYLCWRNGYCCGRNGEDSLYSDRTSSTEIFYFPIEDSHSVSLIFDNVDSEAEFSPRSSHSGRQRGGADYSFNYKEEKMLFGLPLKRLKSFASKELKSPGKRPKNK